MITASGTITNRSKDRYVRRVEIKCQITKTMMLTETDTEWHTVNIEVGPGETESFPEQDLEQFEPIHGKKVTTQCRLDQVHEEKPEARQGRHLGELVGLGLLGSEPLLERKRYRESTRTPWGRVLSFWR